MDIFVQKQLWTYPILAKIEGQSSSGFIQQLDLENTHLFHNNRWSARLERGEYVEGHDPEVSKAPARRSCFHDMTLLWHQPFTWVCGLTKGRMERRRDLEEEQLDQLQCSHFTFNLTVRTLGTVDMSSKVNGLWTNSFKKGKKPNNHKL